VAQAATSDTKTYQNKLMGLLGSRDPITVLAETPESIARLISPHSVDVLRRRPFAERWTWTPLEIVGHLVDVEFVYGFRVRMILCQERPTILGMDQEKWVAGQRYNEREAGELIADFRGVRGANLKLWRQVRPEQMSRVGVHSERGEESLGLMLKMHAGHDLSHLDQIKRYLAAITQQTDGHGE